MGELDAEPFVEAMKHKYNTEEAEDRASELRSLWDEYLRDANWHPLKNIEQSNGTYKVCISTSLINSSFPITYACIIVLHWLYSVFAVEHLDCFGRPKYPWFELHISYETAILECETNVLFLFH